VHEGIILAVVGPPTQVEERRTGWNSQRAGRREMN